MQGLARCTALCALLIPLPCQPAIVMRCEDSSGHITFTQFGCTEDQTQRRERFMNTPPGSVLPPPVTPLENTQATPVRVTVVGEKESPCGIDLSTEERRRSIIRQQIRPGMTQADVESSLGKPDSIRQHNGQTIYLYQAERKSRNSKRKSVSFDENGCVKGNIRKTSKANKQQ